MSAKGTNAITSSTLEALDERAESVAEAAVAKKLAEAGISSDGLDSEAGGEDGDHRYLTRGDLKNAFKMRCLECKETGVMSEVLGKLDTIKRTIDEWRWERTRREKWKGIAWKVGLAVVPVLLGIIVTNAVAQMKAERAAQDAAMREMQAFVAQQKAALHGKATP